MPRECSRFLEILASFGNILTNSYWAYDAVNRGASSAEPDISWHFGGFVVQLHGWNLDGILEIFDARSPVKCNSQLLTIIFEIVCKTPCKGTERIGAILKGCHISNRRLYNAEPLKCHSPGGTMPVVCVSSAQH